MTRPSTRGGASISPRITPYLLIAPTAILILGFMAYPIGRVFYLSLRHHNVTQPWENGFAGLENFSRMFQDDVFWHSLGFSVQWVVVEVGLQFLLGLGLALILNETFVGRAMARAVLFAPWAVNGMLITAVWSLLYNPTTGILQYTSAIGIGSPDTALLATSGSAFWAAVVAQLWHGVPFFAILILAELQSARPDLYEAASIDGANALQRFWYVTVPHLRRAIVMSTLLRVVWEFNNVDLLYSLTGGGPANQTTTLPLYIARKAINDFDFGYGAAMTVVAFVALLAFSLIYLRMGNTERGASTV